MLPLNFVGTPLPPTVRLVQVNAPTLLVLETARLLKLPVGPVRVPVIATVPSTDKLEASADVVFFTRICHP